MLVAAWRLEIFVGYRKRAGSERGFGVAFEPVECQKKERVVVGETLLALAQIRRTQDEKTQWLSGSSGPRGI
jgi:hypothetical protein